MAFRSSVSWPLTVAVAEALLADGAFTALCGAGGVYADDVPEGTPLPYVQFGSSTENADDSFMRTGRATFLDVHIFASTRESAMAVYDAAANVVNGESVLDAASGMAQWRGTLSLTAIIRDPTGAAHVVGNYQCQSVEVFA
jgi:hypothetical protein